MGDSGERGRDVELQMSLLGSKLWARKAEYVSRKTGDGGRYLHDAGKHAQI